MDLIEDDDHIDAAILDVNLRGEMVFPAAKMLEDRDMPFLFATGYDDSAIPARFRSVPRCEKPIGSKTLSRVLMTIIDKAR